MMYGEEEAVKWANGFQFDQGMLDDVVEEFIGFGCNFKELVRSRSDRIASGRISVQSVRRVLSPDNPELQLLVSLVERGMPLFLSPEFVPNGSAGGVAVSNTYLRVSAAVNRMLSEDFVEKGLAVVLPKKLCVEFVPGLHLSRVSWTAKANKKKGRPIIDCSAGEPSLNSDHTKLECDREWGEIHHPGIADVVVMILDFWDQVKGSAKWEDLILWKVDLKGAYTLLSFSEGAVPYVSAELTEDRVILFLSGIFGWTGTPACFQVVTRALVWEFRQVVSGSCVMYVDDACGVSLKKDVAADVAKVSDICRTLFRAECIESSKTEMGRRIDFIGYTIDLDLLRVSVTERNFLKALYGFFTVDLRDRVPVKFLQKLASWASRYSGICWYLSPFVHTIYRSYAGLSGFATVKLDDHAVRTLRVFRALLACAAVDEVRWTRPMSTFSAHEGVDLTVQFDASLTGAGVLWIVEEGGREECVGAASFDFGSWGVEGSSAFQNTCEFMGLFLGVLGVRVLFPAVKRVALRGDSVTALTWCSKRSFKGAQVSNAAVGLVLLLILHGIQIVRVDHVPAEDNYLADALSRGYDVPEVCGLPKVELDFSGVIELCNPTVQYDDDESFVEFWKSIMAICS